jgi:hypothetical protein
MYYFAGLQYHEVGEPLSSISHDRLGDMCGLDSSGLG